MPIDLDSLIYAVPCGEPGDVNALSGRAHICSDRMRIAVTECEPFEPVDCPVCLLDTAPEHYALELVDLVFCEGCHVYSSYPPGDSLHLSQSGLYDPSPLRFLYSQPQVCVWGSTWGGITLQWFNQSSDCTDGAWEPLIAPCIAQLALTSFPYRGTLTIRQNADGNFRKIFEGSITFPEQPDCREDIVIPNQLPLYCFDEDHWDGHFGYGGHAILRAM